MLYVQCIGTIRFSQHLISLYKRTYKYVRCSGFDQSFLVEVLLEMIEHMVEALYI